MKTPIVGIKNLSGQIFKKGSNGERWGRIGCELENIELEQFRDLLKDYPHMTNRKAFTVDYATWESNEYGYKSILLNDSELQVCDENLPKFSLVASLLKKIKTSKEAFPITPKHLESPTALYNVYMDIPEEITAEHHSWVKKAHELPQAQKAADYISEQIDRFMAKYFNVKYEDILEFRKNNPEPSDKY